MHSSDSSQASAHGTASVAEDIIHLKAINVARPPFLGGGQWEIGHLREINVIFGRNGCGKSQLLRLLCQQDIASRHYASPERGGSIQFDAGVAQREGTDSERNNFRMKNYAEQFRMEAVARIQVMYCRAAFYHIDLNIHELEGALEQLMPGFLFRFIASAPFYQLSRNSPPASITQIAELSSGEAQLFALGLDLLTISSIWEIEKKPSRVLLIDEPDLHLHPDLQQQFSKFLILLMQRFKVQIFVATHSTTLLAALGSFGREKTAVVYLLPNSVPVSAIQFSKYHAELATCLGGHALMGPLFSVPLLLVEGDDDYRVWAQAVRSGVLKLAVLPAGGDEILKYANALEVLFAALLERHDSPSAYVLTDRDDGRGDPQSKEHVKRVRLACREVENLFLADETLQRIGTNWEDAKASIVKLSSRCGAKAGPLQALVSADRKSADLKGLMDCLVEILDPQRKVDWRIRIGQVLGAAPPQGQLADFLGLSVVSAFWRNSTAQIK